MVCNDHGHSGCDIKDFEHLSAGQVASKIYLCGSQLHMFGISGLLVHTKIYIYGKTKLIMPFFNQKKTLIYNICTCNVPAGSGNLVQHRHVLLLSLLYIRTIRNGILTTSPSPVSLQ